MNKARERRAIWMALLAAALLAGCADSGEADREEEAPPAVSQAAEEPQLEISEVMAANRCTLDDGSGSFPDWLELHNAGTEPAELGGCVLVCSGDRWEIPAQSLEPDGYALFFCSEEGEGASCAPFGISSRGETVSLEGRSGAELDSFTVPEAQADVSYVRDGGGAVVPAAYATPGAANTPEGYALSQASRSCDSPLQLNEAMVYNEWYLPVNGVFYDWVEVKNVSDGALNLAAYSMSDRSGDRYWLPDVTLEAGETYLIPCTDGQADGATFALNAQEDALYLLDDAGLCCDYMRLSGLRYGGSYGRMAGENGFFYFDSPSPGADNAGGARLIAEKPRLAGSDGVFDGVDSVEVRLEADGQIFYTLDGSDPDASSRKYEGPFSLTETTVVRAVSLQEGALISESLDLSFIINEGHTLPVVSLVTDPANLFGDEGLYDNPEEDWERRGTVCFFEDGQGFHIGCGLKLHGATSKISQKKKSFKLNFRSRYDGELNYDLFENGVTSFASILLRAAQESDYSTMMRDNLMHQLSMECFPDLPAQDYKYAALYLNGEYWGAYNIREAHSATHYANHYGYDVDTVSHWKEDWPLECGFEEVYQFSQGRDMRIEDNYNYVTSHLNMESVLGWIIIEAYSSNFDIHPPNMRFYYSTEDDLLRFALVDLDLGMFAVESFERPFGYDFPYDLLVRAMSLNQSFREDLLKELSRALHGPLSNEHVLAEIDALAAELASEIPRDCQRWNWTVRTWENMVDQLRTYVTGNGGRAAFVARNLCERFAVGGDKAQELYGDIPGFNR